MVFYLQIKVPGPLQGVGGYAEGNDEFRKHWLHPLSSPSFPIIHLAPIPLHYCAFLFIPIQPMPAASQLPKTPQSILFQSVSLLDI